MKDPRIELLARNLVHYSLGIKPGEVLYLEIKGRDVFPLAREVISETTKAGGIPMLFYTGAENMKRFVGEASTVQVESFTQIHLDLMKKSQCYLGIRGDDNSFDMSDVPRDKMKFWNSHFGAKVHMEQRVKHTRWCVMRYPNNAMATMAEQPQEAFEKFYFDVCTLDYAKLSRAMDSLTAMMQRTDRVRLKGPGTDISFSIKGIPAIKCDGKVNIPDGEVFTAPVKTSVNGCIQFNTPTMYNGTLFRNIRLEFVEGKIVKATCEGDQKKLDDIFNTDEGARYTGEFAIGVNPHIHSALKDILFDEKIWGSIHLTPGACYDEASNGNKSAVHWDLVMIQTPEYGGGEMYFDDVLVRKDGEFVHPDLKPLTRAALVGA
jgi:aminopeptidase